MDRKKKCSMEGQLSLFPGWGEEDGRSGRRQEAAAPEVPAQGTGASAVPVSDTVASEAVASEAAVQKVYDHSLLFTRLAASPFRSRFHLRAGDRDYIRAKGLDTIRRHAADFVAGRLAPAFIPNDGKQTPMRGHPVFVAQHATACCCRQCFYKWHHIPPGRELTAAEQRYAVSVLMAWIEKQCGR